MLSICEVLQNSTVIILLLVEAENEGLYHDARRVEIAQLA